MMQVSSNDALRRRMVARAPPDVSVFPSMVLILVPVLTVLVLTLVLALEPGVGVQLLEPGIIIALPL